MWQAAILPWMAPSACSGRSCSRQRHRLYCLSRGVTRLRLTPQPSMSGQIPCLGIVLAAPATSLDGRTCGTMQSAHVCRTTTPAVMLLCLVTVRRMRCPFWGRRSCHHLRISRWKSCYRCRACSGGHRAMCLVRTTERSREEWEHLQLPASGTLRRMGRHIRFSRLPLDGSLLWMHWHGSRTEEAPRRASTRLWACR